jgi:hypothetical protein
MHITSKFSKVKRMFDEQREQKAVWFNKNACYRYYDYYTKAFEFYFLRGKNSLRILNTQRADIKVLA